MFEKELTKEAFGELDEKIQTLYVEEGEGFKFNYETLDDVAALKRSKEHESSKRKELKAQLDAVTGKLSAYEETEFKEKTQSKTADTELDKAWNTKYEATVGEFTQKLSQSESFIREALVDNVALTLAHKLAGDSADILLPHIKARLDADFSGDKPKTSVKDMHGNAGAMNIQDLEKEFLENKKFSPIITASRASGSGASHSTNDKSGAFKKKLSDMTGTERAIFANKYPEEYAKLKKAT